MKAKSILLIWLMCAWLVALAPAHGASTGEVKELDEVRAQLAKVTQLIAAVDAVREWHRDGLNVRIDQLGIRVLTRLNEIAPRLLAAFESGTRERSQLEGLLEQSAALALQRIQVLEQRAAAEREPLPKFEQNAQADIARAFIEDLTSMGKDYIEAYIHQAEIRRAAGLESEPMFQKARERLSLIIERLMGQVRLDAMSLDELRARRAEEPLREDLQKAVDLVQTKQTRNLHNLERAIEIGGNIGIATAEQRSLLIRERGQVDLEILQRDVFSKLWDEQFSRLSESLARNGPDVLFRFLLFSFVVVVAWAVSRLIRHPVRALVHRERLGLSYLLRDTLVTLSSFAVFLLGLVVALATLGVSLGPIFAGLGVIGILVGLAVQDSLGNLAAGAMILVYRPYDVDDRVKVAGAEGIVKRMNLLATTVATIDNQMLVVPNGRIWGDTIVNLTANRVRRVDVKVNVSYAEDPDRVHAVLMDVLEQHEHVLAKPEPEVHMVGMEDSAVAMVVKPWVRTEHYWSTLWDLNRKIKKRLDAEGIEIPFPQRVVTLRSPEDAPPSKNKLGDKTVPD
jgi:small conductance mechanosensitive channel